MIDGAKLGVLVMLAVLFAVQGGFVGFFLYLRKRAKRIADIELDTEWSELQGAPKTSLRGSGRARSPSAGRRRPSA